MQPERGLYINWHPGQAPEEMRAGRNPGGRETGPLVRAAGLVRRIGINLNQAVAKLNATGQRSGDLLPYAIESIRRAERLDTAAEQVRKAIR